MPEPADWAAHVNAPEGHAELDGVRRSVARGRPFGSPAWQQETARRLGLQASLRPRGRPKKASVGPELF